MPLNNVLYLPPWHRRASQATVPPTDPGDPEPPPPPPPPPDDATYFDLHINPSFDRSSPKLKNGQALSGRALLGWQGLDTFLSGNVLSGYTPSGNIESRATRQSLYYYAREVAVVMNLILMIVRLFGDARALDWAVRIADLQYGKLLNRPIISDLGSSVPMPIHDYRRWPWDAGGTNNTYDGNDNHLLDNPRTHAPLLMLLQALRENEDETSPSNINYGAKADMWEAYFLDWLKAWQGPEQKPGIRLNSSRTGWVSASGWASVYKGSGHIYYNNGSSSYKRAGFDGQPLWPIFSRHLTHTHIGCSALHYYLGKAIPSLSAATTVGLHGITELFLNRNVYYWDPSSSVSPYSGEHAVWPRALLWTGHYDDNNYGHNYPQPSVYASYVAMDLMNMWLAGALPDLPTQWCIPMVKTMNAMMWVEESESYSGGEGIAPDLLDGRSVSAATNARGDTIPIRSAIGESGWGSSTRGYAVTNVLSTLMAWDTSDDHMETHLEAMLKSSSAFSSNGYSAPKVMGPNLGLVLKHVGAKDWYLDNGE